MSSTSWPLASIRSDTYIHGKAFSYELSIKRMAHRAYSTDAGEVRFICTSFEVGKFLSFVVFSNSNHNIE